MGGRRADEDWEKPRKTSTHFTEEEKALIRAHFLKGTKVIDVARELKSSTRTISHHYTLLRAEGLAHGAQTERPNHRPANYTARLYKPNFEV